MEITVIEAQELEKRFLGSIEDAQDAFERIVESRAWVQLGHETFVDWYQTRVVPKMRSLSAKPTKELQEVVIKTITAEEANLPKAQQHRSREIADLVGMSQAAVSAVVRSASEQKCSDVDQGKQPDSSQVIEATVASLENIERHDLAAKLQSGEVTVDQVHEVLAAEAAEEKKASESDIKRTADLLVALRKLRRTTREVSTKFIELMPLGVAANAPEVFAEHVEWLEVAIGYIKSTLSTGTIDEELVKLIEEESNSD